MEATMTYSSEHEAVSFGGAFVRQFRFLWAARRPLLLAVAILAVLVLAGEPWTVDAKMRLLLVWPVWVFVVPVFWAFAVFHNEGPSSRYYFWAQPTGRAGHTMARLAAGLAWMWIMYAVLILAGWVFGLADGNAWQMGEIGFAGWLNMFTGPLLIYLAIAILTVPSDYPIRWFFGIIFAIPLLVSMFEDWLSARQELMEQVFAPLVNENWGYFTTAAGAMVKDISRLDVTIRQMSDPMYTGGHVWDGAQLWGVATPIWILVLVGIVAFIATRHPDTLPKWRGFRR